jgi:glycosyltransferase involved in cell wall biosynthesis
MTGVDIVIPVLNRPQNAEKVVSSIRAATSTPFTITFVCTKGDEAEIDAVDATGESYVIVPWPAGPGDGAMKWNSGYRQGKFPYVFLAADDLEFQPDWDLRVLEVAEKSNAGVIGTNDDANPLVKRGLHSTHSLVARRYIDSVGGTWHDGPGVVYCEQYAHQWVDTELVAAAKERGEWAFAHRSVVRHLHPIFNKATPYDETYRKALGDAREDSALFKERQRLASVGVPAGGDFVA